jgi:hypothetical protein
MLNLYPSFGVPHTPKYRDYKACFAAIVGFRSAFCFGRERRTTPRNCIPRLTQPAPGGCAFSP